MRSPRTVLTHGPFHQRSHTYLFSPLRRRQVVITQEKSPRKEKDRTSVQTPPADSVTCHQPSKVPVKFLPLGTTWPLRLWKPLEKRIDDRRAVLGKSRISNVDRPSEDALLPTRCHPKRNEKKTVCRWYCGGTARGARKARGLKGKQLIKVGRRHSHISEEASLCDELSIEAAEEVARKGRHAVALSKHP